MPSLMPMDNGHTNLHLTLAYMFPKIFPYLEEQGLNIASSSNAGSKYDARVHFAEVLHIFVIFSQAWMSQFPLSTAILYYNYKNNSFDEIASSFYKFVVSSERDCLPLMLFGYPTFCMYNMQILDACFIMCMR